MFQGQTQNYIFNNKTVEHHKILSTAHRNGNKSQLPPNNYYVDCAGECESSTSNPSGVEFGSAITRVEK